MIFRRRGVTHRPRSSHDYVGRANIIRHPKTRCLFSSRISIYRAVTAKPNSLNHTHPIITQHTTYTDYTPYLTTPPFLPPLHLPQVTQNRLIPLPKSHDTTQYTGTSTLFRHDILLVRYAPRQTTHATHPFSSSAWLWWIAFQLPR